MNVLTIFDQRITAIFEASAPGQRLPFSFKRLAKRAVREMEDETFVIDGVDTAPALYTILVSQESDAVMRPMYVDITNEISQLIEAQAKKRGYTFVGRPLVRFMVDPALRGGRFSVFAENIDPRTLARLRDEENVYLGITPPHEIFPQESFVPTPIPVHEEEPMPISSEVSFVEDPFASDAADDDLMGSSASIPSVDALDEDASVPEIDPFEFVPEDYVAEPDALEDSIPAPIPEFEPEPVAIDPVETAAAASAAAISAAVDAREETSQDSAPVCTLVDLGNGKTYRITTEVAPIGRERVSSGIVLTDPNASRRHAELFVRDGDWYVRDLNSTNGTLVNDVDIDEVRLNNGDVLTIGITNLEFRAG